MEVFDFVRRSDWGSNELTQETLLMIYNTTTLQK
jgi:hypothetical protein